MTKDKAKQLEAIKQQIIRKKVGQELAEGATQLVFGDGNPDAEIVFVGEAPGKNEDLQGLPFVGAAGKFLEEMLKGIGLKRQDVYITNIVKYRPPNNRDPFPDEKAAFLPFLKHQLMTISPKLIVTLGRHAMETLLPGLKISQCHGQPKRIKVRVSGPAEGKGTSHGLESSARKKRSAEQAVHDVQSVSTAASDKAMPQESRRHAVPGSATGRIDTWVVLPLFHPAAALYNSSMRQTLIEDFSKIPAVLARI